MKPRTTTKSSSTSRDVPVGTSILAVDAEKAVGDENGLTDNVLRQICRLRERDPQVTLEWIAKLRRITRLLVESRLGQEVRLEAAMTLLASALGQLTQYNPTHLPFGYNGPTVRSRDWIERQALERVGKQIVGLMWGHATAEAVASAVQQAVSEGIRLGFLEQREYDAWRPGMPSGSGWRFAVTATPYGVTRALLLVESGHRPNPAALKPRPVARTEAEDNPEALTDSETVADQGADAPGPSNDSGGLEKRQYRKRLLELCEARGLFTPARPTQNGRDVQDAAARLAEELAAWVEAISEAEADRHPAGAYWTMLGEDLEEMLGPAELTTGQFEDDWTPLLTQLQMSGLGEVAATLDRLAKEVIPEAEKLARDLDAVAYLRNGGPRDAFYDLYAQDGLANHEAGVCQGRQDVARSVMKIVGMLRTLADGGASDTVPAVAASNRNPRPRPRRGTRTANIEKLERELEQHLLAARDHAHSLRDRGREPVLLPRPTQKQLARRTGLTESDVSRCLNDKRAKVLKILWETANSLEVVMTYKRRR